MNPSLRYGPRGPGRGAVFATLLGGIVGLFAGGCGDSIVGATCADGFQFADGRCVPVAVDGAPPDGGLSDGGMDGAVADGAVLPDGAVVLPDGAVVLPDGAVRDGSVLPDGAVVLPDGAVVLPDGAVRDGSVFPDGSVFRDGSVVLPDGAVVLPDGSVLRDGSVLPDGSVVRDGSVVLPDGAVVLPDGAVVLPDGGGPFDGGPNLDGAVDLDGSMSPDGGGPVDGGVCDIGQLSCNGRCVRPETDPENCGVCGNICPPGDVCVSGTCLPICPPGLLLCGPLCIDPMGNDPDNCGACGRVCASGICVAGTCAAAAVGHVTVVGHDYTVGREGINRVAGNAVFLATGAPVRVAVYEGTAVGASVRGVNRAINQVAMERGRSWVRTSVTAANLLVQLASADALVILPQPGSTDAELEALGTDLRVGLSSFLRRGGAIVLFDTPSASNIGTWQILQAAMLFSATGITEVSGDTIDLVSPADAVALGVPPLYFAETNSVSFTTMESDVVCEHSSGPVVLHRTVVP